MNICMIASGYPSKSKPVLDVFIHEQAREMVKQGLNVHVIIPSVDDSPREETVEGVHVHRVINSNFKPARLFSFVFAVKVMRKAARLNKTEKFDVVHSHFADHAGFAGAIISKILRRPFVLTTHGYDVYYSKELGYGIGTTWLGRVYTSFILKRADKICPVSNALKKQCITRWHINPKKLEVNHDGTHITKPPAEDELNRFKSILNIDDKKVILSVSSLIKRKGHQNIVKALPAVIREVPDAIFILVGEGPYLPELERLIKELKLQSYVKITNRFANRSELPMFLSICDVFVLASVLEAFGIVYLEALALGKPVIGSRGEGDEDFIVDGENGFLVDPTNTDELAKRIVVLLKDKSLRESMGQKGKKDVVESYLWKHNVEKLARTYEELVRQ
ncbi:glycosyltransferase family 4 protein [Chloroflexota bacterium]